MSQQQQQQQSSGNQTNNGNPNNGNDGNPPVSGIGNGLGDQIFAWHDHQLQVKRRDIVCVINPGTCVKQSILCNLSEGLINTCSRADDTTYQEVFCSLMMIGLFHILKEKLEIMF